MGMVIKLANLKTSLRKINITGAIKIELMDRLRASDQIPLWSPIGVVALFGLCLLLSLLFVHLVGYLVSHDNMSIITETLRYLVDRVK